MKEEKEKLPPGLEGLRGKDPGFRLPDGYFDKMQQEVIDRLAAEGWKQDQAKVRQLPLRRYWAVAASLALALSAGLYLLLRQPATESPVFAVQASTEEVQAYLVNHIDDIDLDMLLEFADEAGIGDDNLLPKTLGEDEFDKYMDELLDEVDVESLEKLL